MVKSYEIVTVDAGTEFEGQLGREILVMAFAPARKQYFFFRTDMALKGTSSLRKFKKMIGRDFEIRAICAESLAARFRDEFSQLKEAQIRLSSFKRRCRWKFTFNAGSLKFLAEDKIRVLIVDDSKTIRSLLEKVFRGDPDFEIAGSIENPLLVPAEIEKLKPDVMTLDIHMPGMTGVELLRKIMPTTPVPTVMVSSVGIEEGREVLTALELGAVDYVQKPSLEELPSVAPLLIEKVKIAADVDLRQKMQKHGVGRLRGTPRPALTDLDHRKVICIGSSTGGTEAIRRMFSTLPNKFPPILITQHIPKHFSLAFAESLRKELGYEVFEAKDEQSVLPNQILIAPGGTQMELQTDKSGELKVRIFDGEPVNRHKPSVDVLFHSAAKLLGKRAIGVILTGMGGDGAKGMKAMKDAGAFTIAQDQETSVVYGMPRVAVELGGVCQSAGIDQICDLMLESSRAKKAA